MTEQPKTLITKTVVQGAENVAFIAVDHVIGVVEAAVHVVSAEASSAIAAVRKAEGELKKALDAAISFIP